MRVIHLEKHPYLNAIHVKKSFKDMLLLCYIGRLHISAESVGIIKIEHAISQKMNAGIGMMKRFLWK